MRALPSALTAALPSPTYSPRSPLSPLLPTRLVPRPSVHLSPWPSTRPLPFPTRPFHSAAASFADGVDVEASPVGRAAPLVARWQRWKPRLVTYLWVGAALLLGVAILRGGLWVVSFFSSLDFADVSQVAFVAGLLTAAILMGVGALARRALTLRPEAVYADALRRVLGDATVRAYLGSELRTGAFRAYSFVPGSIRWGQGGAAAEAVVPPAAAEGTGAGWGVRAMAALGSWWRPRRLQLFFQVTGDAASHGMVSAEVEKVKGSYSYNLLCVDVLNTGQRIVLRGDPTYSIYQGVIRLR